MNIGRVADLVEGHDLGRPGRVRAEDLVQGSDQHG